ncbi:MAG TPA: ATP-binding protein [Phycisphaerae bacterium]|nr:ATP-binding protein [Phycisphaerae bacterium]
MKNTSLRPWSLLDELPEEPARIAAPETGETKAKRRISLFKKFEQCPPMTIRALVLIGVSAVWTMTLCMVAPTSRMGRIVNSSGIGLCNLGAVAALYLASRSGRPKLTGDQPEGGAHPPVVDAQAIWQEVERQTASIQSRLNEVVEEHSQMGLELSLALSQKRQATAILEATLDPLLVVDAFDQVQFVNKAAEELLGINRQESQRRSLSEVVQDEKLLQILQQAREAESRAAKRRVEHVIGPRVHSIALGPVISENAADGSSRHGVVAHFRDITKEKDAARHKSDFVAQAAHELRTPLSAISAYVEMLVDGEAGDEKTRAEYYEIIQSSARRLGRMIDNILNISRIEAGTVRIQKAPVAISMLVKQAADTLRPKAEQKKIQLSEELAPVVDRVLGDHDLLEQELLNLLSNAVKYTPEGGQIHVRMVPSDNRTVRIEVADSGVGIPKEDLPRMFEKFFRVEANKAMASGSGLGLSLVKQVVETVHGGEVLLNSEVGRGSTFTIILPLYEGE